MTFIPLVKSFLSSQWFLDVHNMVHFHILTFLAQCLFQGHLRTFQPVKDLLQDLTWQEMEGGIWWILKISGGLSFWEEVRGCGDTF